jgi:lysophospholipase L1-like esterase
MTDVTAVPAVAETALAAEFSPDLLRRLLVEPIGSFLLKKVMGKGQVMRASQFAQLPPPDGQVVMLGDSITELGLWHEWFGGVPVLNRGIGGETSADLLRRLDTVIGSPAAIYLLIGTNDLTLGVSLGDIIGNVRTLLSEVQSRAPGTPVVVQSVMPRTARYREDLRLLNRAYQALVEQAGDPVQYLDLWPALANERGDLRDAYTEDHIHLNGAGYAAWLDVLRPHVDAVLAQTEPLSS